MCTTSKISVVQYKKEKRFLVTKDSEVAFLYDFFVSYLDAEPVEISQAFCFIKDTQHTFLFCASQKSGNLIFMDLMIWVVWS